MFKHLTIPEFLRRFETIDAKCCSACAELRLDLLAYARMHLLVMEAHPTPMWEWMPRMSPKQRKRLAIAAQLEAVGEA